MGPPNKKMSPKKWREYLDKQNARRAVQRKLKKQEVLKAKLRPYIREAIRRAWKAWSHAYDEKVLRGNVYMRKNVELKEWKELVTTRLSMRCEELCLARKELERCRKEVREVKAALQKEIAGLRIQLRTAKRNLRRQWW